ncbi:hypothetical protein DRE_01020 [Drechslerella stenobrocha 248]|uniref:PA14 domain-containing protein n=1 Tax=Drechslerella stenobrocha 248 TaxID=1043628 RepID=W7HLW7_9PEZI|nr:hypothetical protein DRE_01020 [Drechslerella stenobrocha 248]
MRLMRGIGLSAALFAATALGQTCNTPAQSCASVATGIAASCLASFVTVPGASGGFAATVTTTSVVATTTVTSSVFGSNPAVVTTRPVITVTTESTVFTGSASTTTTTTEVTQSTNTINAGLTIQSTTTVDGAPPARRLAKRQAAPPADCSCFLTSTVLSTSTGASGGNSGTTTVTVSSTSTSVVQTSVGTSVVTSASTVLVFGRTVTGASTATVTVTKNVVAVVINRPTITSIATIYRATMLPNNCANGGIEVGLYSNAQTRPGGGGDYFTVFVPESYKTATPIAVTIVSSIGIPHDASQPSGGPAAASPYGMPPVPTNLYVLNHRGYFYAPVSGRYNFSFTQADDYAGLWVGQNAYSAWERSNLNAVALIDSGTAVRPTSYAIDLEAGSYTPFRIVYGNGLGKSEFNFAITGPGGQFFVANIAASPYIVRFACDPSVAAPFMNPFQKEDGFATGSADLSCGNTGVEVAIFANPYTPASSIPAENFKGRADLQPAGSTFVSRIGFRSTAWTNPYGLTPPSLSPLAYALLWRGYFYAPVAGTYRFTIFSADDYAAVWLGATALTGWTGQNANAARLLSDGATPASGTADLTAGQYLPIRVLLATVGGNIALDFEIVHSSGLYYARTNTTSPWLVSGACGSGSAPRFPDPIGEEA